MPTPLVKPLPRATELPLADLGPLIEPVRAIETLTQAPTALILNAVLASIAVAVQGHANVQTLSGDCAPTSLFCFSIAASGERKTQVDRLATSAIREFEAPLLDRFRKDLQRFEEQKNSGRASTFSIGLIDDPSSDREEPPLDTTPPTSPQILFEDLTVEGKLRHFENGRPSTGIFTDEGGIILGGYSMSSSNREKTAALLSKFWDGKPIMKNTAGGQAVFLPNRRVSAHIAVQPAIALETLSDQTLRDQGLFARFLMAFPDTNQGKRFIRMDQATIVARQEAQATLTTFKKRLRDLLNLKLPTTDRDPLQLAPRTLELEDEAILDLVEFFNVTEEAHAEGLRYAEVRAHASKAAEQAARIAGVLTLFEDQKATCVSRRHMSIAINLTNFYLEEALRVFAAGTVPKHMQEAERLRVWLRDMWEEEFVDVSAVAQRGPNALRSADRVKQLFAVLKEYGWLRKVEGSHIISGRKSRRAYQVVRG